MLSSVDAIHAPLRRLSWLWPQQQQQQQKRFPKSSCSGSSSIPDSQKNLLAVHEVLLSVTVCLEDARATALATRSTTEADEGFRYRKNTFSIAFLKAANSEMRCSNLVGRKKNKDSAARLGE